MPRNKKTVYINEWIVPSFSITIKKKQNFNSQKDKASILRVSIFVESRIESNNNRKYMFILWEIKRDKILFVQVGWGEDRYIKTSKIRSVAYHWLNSFFYYLNLFCLKFKFKDLKNFGVGDNDEPFLVS